MIAFKISFFIYMVIFLVTFYYCGRWAFMAGRWHLGYIREHGFQNGLRNFYNPFQLWPNIRRIWREVPGSKTVFTRAAFWLVVISVIQDLWWFQLLPLAAP